MEIQRPNSPFPKLQSNDATLLTLIKSDFLYPEVIKKYRRLAKLSESGIDYTNPSVFTNEIERIDVTRLLLSTLRVLSFYNLPVRWLMTFLFILLIDEPCPPSEEPIKSVDVQYVEPLEKSPYQFGEIIISVRQGLSKSRLLSSLDNDITLNEMLRKLPNNPDVSKIETKQVLEALALHKEGMTLKDIAALWNKRTKKPYAYDYKKIDKLITNFKKYVRNQSSRNNRSRILFAIEETLHPKKIT